MNNEGFENLRAKAGAVLESPSWLRDVPGEPLVRGEYGGRCSAPPYTVAIENELWQRCDQAAWQCELNQSQRGAFELATRNRFVLVQGPLGLFI